MKRIWLFIALVMSLVACDNSDNQENMLKITRLKDNDLFTRAGAACFVISDKAYIVAGRTKDISNQDSLTNSCYFYDTSNETWGKKSDFPGSKRVNLTAISINEKGYAGLGFVGKESHDICMDSIYLNDWWMYDPVNDNWTQKASFPERCTNDASVFTYNNEIYIIHGFGSCNFSDSFYKYNPLEDKWIKLKDFPGLSRMSAVVCTDGTRIFSGTGYCTRNAVDWWEYFPESDSWIQRRNISVRGRINAMSFSIGERFFVASGRYFRGTHTGGHLKNDIVEYDAMENNWHTVGLFPGNEGEREHGICFTIGDKAYIGLGENLTCLKSDMWLIEPK